MKKVSCAISVLLLLIFVLFENYIFSQSQLPNAGFENWSGNPLAPDGWETWETLSQGQITGFAVKDTSTNNFVEGKASVKLITDSAVLPNLGKVLLAGTAEYYGPFNDKPDTIKFAYKYSANLADTAIINVNLFGYDANGNVVNYINGQVRLQRTNNQWINTFVPISYSNSQTGNPDTLIFSLLSSKDLINKGVKGSTAWFDNIRFSYKKKVGIQEAALEYADIKLFPNPTNNFIRFQGHKDLSGHTFKAYSLDGKEINQKLMQGNEVDISILPVGTYVFEIVKENFVALKGKFIVSK
ncbi:MAG: T9SS type A sorting domain-containing protein [Chitinophagales bacterium]|nr:T9SS type A sorting domain-containing protein [Chitinophagales bacterium]MDW8274070.1 T9SS type A sorting domain-containing protein [Chitinophagales bacterium]